MDQIEKIVYEKGNRSYWTVTNGYTFSDRESLPKFAKLLDKNPEIVGEIIGNLKIGVHNNVDAFDIWNNIHNNYEPIQRVNQAFCLSFIYFKIFIIF